MSLEKSNREKEYVNGIQTNTKVNLSDDVCDSCVLLKTRFDDSAYRENNCFTAYCQYTGRDIKFRLTKYEISNIKKPVWCPKLMRGREE